MNQGNLLTKLLSQLLHCRFSSSTKSFLQDAPQHELIFVQDGEACFHLEIGQPGTWKARESPELVGRTCRPWVCQSSTPQQGLGQFAPPASLPRFRMQNFTQHKLSCCVFFLDLKRIHIFLPFKLSGTYNKMDQLTRTYGDGVTFRHFAWVAFVTWPVLKTSCELYSIVLILL